MVRRTAPWFGNAGSVQFDYGACTVRLLPGHDEAEGRMVAEWLEKRLPQGGLNLFVQKNSGGDRKKKLDRYHNDQLFRASISCSIRHTPSLSFRQIITPRKWPSGPALAPLPTA